MCFSAQASFTSGAVLTTIGVGTFRQAGKSDRKLFAAIPFLFGLQQLAEGVLWITLKSGGEELVQNVAAHLFLVAALIVWPLMVPASIWMMEEVKKRKKILAGLMAAGGILSLFYTICLIFYKITPQIQSFHIVYLNNFPNLLAGGSFVIYFAATVVSIFVSSVKRMWLFGVLITISLAVTGLFYQEYLTSVWCFFASLMSVSIYWVLSESRSRVDQLTTVFQR